jgi:hypothetical protein
MKLQAYTAAGAAFIGAAISLAAHAAPPAPLSVVVTNPVLPVEVRNADPIPVASTEVAGKDYSALIPPNATVVTLGGPFPADKRLQIGTVTVANGLPVADGRVQIQARRFVGGACVGTPTIYDSLIPMPAKVGVTVAVSYTVPLEFPGNSVDGEWCLAAAGDSLMHVSVVAR